MRNRGIARRDAAVTIDADHADLAQFGDGGVAAGQLRRQQRQRHPPGAIAKPRRQQRIEHRKGVGRQPAIATFGFEEGADDRERQETFFLQALDGAQALNMVVAVECRVAAGPIGLGQQAFADIVTDGFPPDAARLFQISHPHCLRFTPRTE